MVAVAVEVVLQTIHQIKVILIMDALVVAVVGELVFPLETEVLQILVVILVVLSLLILTGWEKLVMMVI